MLRELSLENFKSWREIERMKLAPITGLFGTNSSGKTSILQFLLMLKQTVESRDRFLTLHLGGERSYIDLGSFSEVVHGHDKKTDLSWSLLWNLPDEFSIGDVKEGNEDVFRDDELLYAAEVSEGKSGEIQVEFLQYQFDDGIFSMTMKDNSESTFDLEYEGETRFKFVKSTGRQWPLPRPIKCYGFPDQINSYYQNAGFLSEFELEFEELFSKVYYLGPLRAKPGRRYVWTGVRPADMGSQGENAIASILAAKADGLTLSPGYKKRRLTLEAYLARWLQKLGLIYDFRVERIAKGSDVYHVKVRHTSQSAEVLLTDVGFGVSQILPVLTLCLYVPEQSIVLLEQPEIHLHPSVQEGLADFFIEVAVNRRIQLIIESHSEHLLRRLQRRIAEGVFDEIQTAEGRDLLAEPKDMIKLYFCERKNGASELTPLELDIFGNIENWPKDFFGDQFGEMAAMQKAILKKKRSLKK